MENLQQAVRHECPDESECDDPRVPVYSAKAQHQVSKTINQPFSHLPGLRTTAVAKLTTATILLAAGGALRTPFDPPPLLFLHEVPEHL